MVERSAIDSYCDDAKSAITTDEMGRKESWVTQHKYIRNSYPISYFKGQSLQIENYLPITNQVGQKEVHLYQTNRSFRMRKFIFYVSCCGIPFLLVSSYLLLLL